VARRKTKASSAETLRAGEARVLELVAADEPLDRTLDALARVFEAQADGMLASILLVEDGVRVRHAAAPNLPPAWIRTIDGEPIGPNQGSCGTAAYLKQPVIVSDIATDARWASYRDAALGFGLRACWSVPILGPDQTVFGTFALYYTKPRKPTKRLLDLAAHASHLATVAIQHRRQRDATLESEARARLIVESALDAHVLMDRDGIVTLWNPRATAIFGWTAGEAVGRRLSELVIPERFRAQHEQGLRHFLASGEGPILNRRLEIMALHRDGRELPVELAVTPIKRGDRVMFSAFIQDLSASKAAAEALRDSQQHLSLVYDHVADVLFQLQVEPAGYRFVAVNPAFTTATGLEPDMVIGKLVHQVIPEPSLSMVLGKYAEALEARKTIRWQETTVYPTGTRYGDVAITPVFDAQGQAKYLVGSVRDVTEQRRMEGEVRQLQKLEAIGRLTAGIAHDFNNILGVILGVGNMLAKDIKDPDERGQVEEIVEASERGAVLTRQFLAFGRKQMLQPEIVELNDVVGQLEKMLRRLVRADITLTTSLGAGLWRVKADPGQIEQVIMNLVVNARDAMPQGGRLVIETANAELDAAFADSHLGVAPGQYVRLAISDTGHGMDEDTKRRIFEPFFTTKEVGKGTGLGLATVYGIVKQSGGYIEVSSAPGEGTKFHVYLPRTTAERTSGRREARKSGAHGLAGVQVLVVEDEPALRRAIARMLTRLKCQVSVAGSGEEALAAAEAQQLAPDVLITDMIMPGMSAGALVERFRAIRPDLKVLLMSGYAADDIVGPANLQSACRFSRSRSPLPS
jgi:two-component system, cell cycle sensor histidine kinase and response regulator CckA